MTVSSILIDVFYVGGFGPTQKVNSQNKILCGFMKIKKKKETIKSRLSKFRQKKEDDPRLEYYSSYLNEVIDLLEKGKYEDATIYLDKALDYLVIQNLPIAIGNLEYDFHLYGIINTPRAMEFLYDFGYTQKETLNYFRQFKNFRNNVVHLITGKEGGHFKKLKSHAKMRRRGIITGNYVIYEMLFKAFGEKNEEFDKLVSEWKKSHKKHEKMVDQKEYFLSAIEAGLRAYIGLKMVLDDGFPTRFSHFDPNLMEKEAEFIKKDHKLYVKCLNKASKKIKKLAKSEDLDPFNLFGEK